MKRVLDFLSELRPLEWARAVGGCAPLRPPYVAWRFASADDELEQQIAASVRSYAGAIKWRMSKGDRNWVIEPEGFAEFAKDFRVDVEGADRFAAAFPRETTAALEDSERLATHLRETIQPGRAQ